jgi:uncharacterized integral membrane protein (TIGR00698 family)
VAALCALPVVTPPLALAAGLVFALVIGNVDAARAARVQKQLLQASVVGLGFGVQFGAVVAAGATGFLVTAVSLTATLALGLWLARWFGVERVTGHLIASGTAICGGSAIAAMGPVLGAQARVMSVALGCVFVLNAVALFVFPPVGHALGLSPEQFGYWAAIAIHDTSSVVGAAARFGEEALALAVPMKLARALWILPLVAWMAWREKRRGTGATVPWFVFLFLGASALVTLVPAGAPVYPILARVARGGLAVTLFLIGAGLSRSTLASVGWRPAAFSVMLWLVVSLTALAAVKWLV